MSDRARAYPRMAWSLGEERRDVQQRWQEHEQHEVGIQLDLGHARQEPERQPAEDQHDRVRDADAGGNHVEDGDRHQHPGEDDVEAFHPESAPWATPVGRLHRPCNEHRRVEQSVGVVRAPTPRVVRS